LIVALCLQKAPPRQRAHCRAAKAFEQFDTPIGMFGARAAMKHQQHRLFPHHRAVGDQLRALDVEEQPHPVHGHLHGLASFS